jgi:hypothetical protein
VVSGRPGTFPDLGPFRSAIERAGSSCGTTPTCSTAFWQSHKERILRAMCDVFPYDPDKASSASARSVSQAQVHPEALRFPSSLASSAFQPINLIGETMSDPIVIVSAARHMAARGDFARCKPGNWALSQSRRPSSVPEFRSMPSMKC